MGLNIELLGNSIELLEPQAETLVSRFYDRLFEKCQVVKPMFACTTMAEQKKTLLASLVLVMQNLRRPDSLGPALKQLGARHVAYGTQPAHYIQRCSGNFVGCHGGHGRGCLDCRCQASLDRGTQHNYSHHAGGRP